MYLDGNKFPRIFARRERNNCTALGAIFGIFDSGLSIHCAISVALRWRLSAKILHDPALKAVLTSVHARLFCRVWRSYAYSFLSDESYGISLDSIDIAFFNHGACSVTRDLCICGKFYLHIWNLLPWFVYSMCNCGGATMKVIQATQTDRMLAYIDGKQAAQLQKYDVECTKTHRFESRQPKITPLVNIRAYGG